MNNYLIKIGAVVAILLVFLNACTKGEKEVSIVPAIEFVSVLPSQPIEYQDSLVFTISYRDGDGNLGENEAGVDNCFLKDLRNGVVYTFRIPQLAPTDASIAIQGNLNVVLQSTAILDASDSQTFNYEIYVVDRDGNQSNIVTSSSVTVSKP